MPPEYVQEPKWGTRHIDDLTNKERTFLMREIFDTICRHDVEMDSVVTTLVGAACLMMDIKYGMDEDERIETIIEMASMYDHEEPEGSKPS